jgi:hypothetical protein
MKGVELYGRVRHAVRIEGLSERAAARRFGLDPRTVNKMMKFSVPPGYVRKKRQHAVNRAGVLFRGLDRGRRPSGGPLIGDDLLQALDAVPGEGGYTVLTDPIDRQTAIFREHVD